MASYAIKVKESEIERYTCLYARQQGWLTFKLAQTAMAGAPDRLFVSTLGHCFFVEFKSEKGKLTRLQEIVRGKLENNLATYLVIKSKKEGKDWIDSWKKTCNENPEIKYGMRTIL